MTKPTKAFGWTQPMCDTDWAEQNGDRIPVRIKHPRAETCAWCGNTTYSGIFMWVDPRTVPYPQEDE
jgi:hypothetical protein